MNRRHGLGWGLFLLSSFFFFVMGVRDGDVLSITASVLFAAGCLLFLVPDRR
jgi:hypothetical protein